MTPETIDELECLCQRGLELVRDARPRPPEPETPGGWAWRSHARKSDWPPGGEPFGLNHGDDVEVMLHGGTKARGNLKGALRWGLVTAYRVHPKAPDQRAPRDGWPA